MFYCGVYHSDTVSKLFNTFKDTMYPLRYCKPPSLIVRAEKQHCELRMQVLPDAVLPEKQRIKMMDGGTENFWVFRNCLQRI